MEGPYMAEGGGGGVWTLNMDLDIVMIFCINYYRK